MNLSPGIKVRLKNGKIVRILSVGNGKAIEVEWIDHSRMEKTTFFTQERFITKIIGGN